MKSKNYKKRRHKILIFYMYFSAMMLLIFTCGVFVLLTAQQGIALLEKKKENYDSVFKKQAEVTFQLEEILNSLYSLRTKGRNSSEHKQMQQIITDNRNNIKEELTTKINNKESYKLFLELLVDVKHIQGVMDYYRVESDKRIHNMDQLEKCRKKYQQLKSK